MVCVENVEMMRKKNMGGKKGRNKGETTRAEENQRICC